MMDYFLLKTLGTVADKSLCFIQNFPEGIGVHAYRPARGRQATEHFPADARIYLREEDPGLKLPGIIGNTVGYFIGSRAVREAVEELCVGSTIEFLPFTLYNHKKRVHSTEYCLINPIGGFDCLSDQSSEVITDSQDEPVIVDRPVLDAKKLTNAPHLFRIDKSLGSYVFSRVLGEAWRSRGVSGLAGSRIPVA
jgi:hypothetical protein